MVAAMALVSVSDAGWWELVNGSTAWQDGVFFSLAALYGLIATASFIQVVRIQYRVPEYGWTTQKIFQHVIIDLPGLAFFTTYAMLALFWAEISYQARDLET
ncbi:hypothetical protein ABZP36_035404 [Zizania latifolia]